MLVLPRLLPLFALRLPIVEVLLSYLHTSEGSRGAEMQPVASKLWGTLCNQLCRIWSQLCDPCVLNSCLCVWIASRVLLLSAHIKPEQALLLKWC